MPDGSASEPLVGGLGHVRDWFDESRTNLAHGVGHGVTKLLSAPFGLLPQAVDPYDWPSIVEDEQWPSLPEASSGASAHSPADWPSNAPSQPPQRKGLFGIRLPHPSPGRAHAAAPGKARADHHASAQKLAKLRQDADSLLRRAEAATTARLSEAELRAQVEAQEREIEALLEISRTEHAVSRGI